MDNQKKALGGIHNVSKIKKLKTKFSLKKLAKEKK